MQGNQPRPAQASPNQSELAHNDLNQSKPIRTVQASPSTAPYLPEPALAAAQNSQQKQGVFMEFFGCFGCF